jgi:hypothetical protein
MKISVARIVAAIILAVLTCSPARAADDDDDKTPNASATIMNGSLTPQQRKALGVVAERPVTARIPDRIASVGLVLDSTMLVADLGDLAATETAARTARAEVTRLQVLYGDHAGASLKMVEAARVEAVKATAQSRLTAARFAQHWAPLASLNPTDRSSIVMQVTRGKALLLRADLPGRHSLGSLPEKAELDVDGVEVHGRVFGFLRQTDETQSLGLLVGVANPPAGLGPGARVPVSLLMARRSGVLLPQDAVLYDERGPYVFKQLTRPEAANSRYERCNVTLLIRRGGGWLVSGVEEDDDIVMEGAGVIWSLQGAGARTVDDDDDD